MSHPAYKLLGTVTTASPAPAGPRILVAFALDLSLVGSGLCRPDGSTIVIRPSKRRAEDRLAFIRDRILEELAERAPVDVVTIEGYSYGSNKAGSNKGTLERAELAGVVKVALHDLRIPLTLIPPKNRAKYATGNGNAGKDLVVQHASARAGRIFDDNNAADAWWLHQMALARYAPESPLLVPVPKINRTALEAIEWAEIKEDR